ncbi:MAG: hypothetical protein IPH44_29660 [Myxococcales bacterium]|nr:hypothetical protein [Myxococcales bacterium]
MWLAAYVAVSVLDKDLTDFAFEATSSGHVDGASASALMSAGLVAAILGWQVDAAATMTGTINPDGTVGPVSGIPQKFAAALAAGKRRLGYPVGQRLAIDAATGAEVDLVALARERGAEAVEIADIYGADRADDRARAAAAAAAGQQRDGAARRDRGSRRRAGRRLGQAGRRAARGARRRLRPRHRGAGRLPALDGRPRSRLQAAQAGDGGPGVSRHGGGVDRGVGQPRRRDRARLRRRRRRRGRDARARPPDRRAGDGDRRGARGGHAQAGDDGRPPADAVGVRRGHRWLELADVRRGAGPPHPGAPRGPARGPRR